MNEADRNSLDGTLAESAEISSLDGYYISDGPALTEQSADDVEIADFAHFLTPASQEVLKGIETARYGSELKLKKLAPHLTRLVLNGAIPQDESDLLLFMAQEKSKSFKRIAAQADTQSTTDTWSPSGMLTDDESPRELDARERQQPNGDR